MWITAAGTFYPTGKMTGIASGVIGDTTAANINAASDTASATATDSPFDPAKQNVQPSATGDRGSPTNCILEEIIVLNPSTGGASLVTIQNHTGTKTMVPALDATGAVRWLRLRQPINQGFRVVSTAAGAFGAVGLVWRMIRP